MRDLVVLVLVISLSFTYAGGLIRIASYQRIVPFLTFYPLKSLEPQHHWYCDVSLTLTGPGNITMEYLKWPIGRQKNGKYLWAIMQQFFTYLLTYVGTIVWAKFHNDSSIVRISVRLPNIYKQFSINLTFGKHSICISQVTLYCHRHS